MKLLLDTHTFIWWDSDPSKTYEFFKQEKAYLPYTEEDLEEDIQTINNLRRSHSINSSNQAHLA